MPGKGMSWKGMPVNCVPGLGPLRAHRTGAAGAVAADLSMLDPKGRP